ncbi:MAG: HDOD domain-containing protein [Phycisphaerae bacterium]|nr:HDOD domain-containing protein [Phycisphaerae bacterium]
MQNTTRGVGGTLHGAEQRPASADSHPPDAIQRILQYRPWMERLRYVGTELMPAMRDRAADAEKLRTVIEQNDEVHARLIIAFRSSVYRTKPEVSTLTDAIIQHGPAHVRCLAVSAAVSDLFRPDAAIGDYRRSHLWRHSVWVATVARMIARRRKILRPDRAFLGGLLHDIGIILEERCVPEKFANMLAVLPGDKPLPDTEREYLGTDHAEIGDRVAETCAFPPTVRAAIRYHHSTEGYREEDAAIIQCVEMANVICTLRGAAAIDNARVATPKGAAAALNLRKQEFRELAADLGRKSAHCEMLSNL